MHWCRQIALYSFTFDDDEGQLTRYLLPLLDLVNHRGDANAHVTRHAASRTFRLEALRAIRCAAHSPEAGMWRRGCGMRPAALPGCQSGSDYCPPGPKPPTPEPCTCRRGEEVAHCHHPCCMPKP